MDNPTDRELSEQAGGAEGTIESADEYIAKLESTIARQKAVIEKAGEALEKSLCQHRFRYSSKMLNHDGCLGWEAIEAIKRLELRNEK